MTSLDDDFNETETREFITDALKSKGWKLKLNMRYEYKITDGRVQIDEDGESYRSEALFADYLLYAPNNQPLCVVEAKRANQIEGTGIQQAINYCNLLNAPLLEQVLPLVDAYENAVLQKEELKSTLSDKVKKAILQEAITGKLTEQWRKSSAITESGEQLLDRIIKERNAKALAEWEEKVKTNPKAKKPAPVVASEIEEEDMPFEIPESWCWCRLGDLVSFGQCENAEPNEIEDEAWILDLEDIEKDAGRILQFKIKKEVESKSTKHVFKKGYVLYSKLRPYLNKCVIAPNDGYCTSEILPLDFGNLINNKFAQTFLMSPYFVDYTDSLSFGVKMPRLGTEDGKKALVPLPPLEEQEEIVKKVEELLPLCR